MNILIKQELEAPPVSAAQLALRFHMDGNRGLESDLPSEWKGPVEESFETHEITAGRIKFQSLAARNELLAKYFFDRYFARDEIDAVALFSIAHALWVREFGQNDLVSGRLVAAAQGQQDIFYLATQALEAGKRCFDIFNLLEAALRFSGNVSVDSLSNFCRTLAILANGQGGMGTFYDILQNWLSGHPDTAREIIHTEHKEFDEHIVSLLSASLLALASEAPQEAVQLLLDEKMPNCLEHHHKLLICGRLFRHPQVSSSEKTRLQQLILNGFTHSDELIRIQAIVAATQALNLSNQFDEALREAAALGEQSILTAISNALSLHSIELLEQGRFLIWLPFLTTLQAEQSLEGLDFALSSAMENSAETQDHIIEFLSSWALSQFEVSSIDKKFVRVFDQCLHEIGERPAVLAKIVTSWINHDDPKLAVVAAAMLDELELDGLTSAHFDLSIIETMSVDDLIFIGRRLLGFVHSTNQLLSLSLSMLGVSPEHLGRIIPLLRSLIVDEIGYDYPGTTIKALETFIQNDVSKEVFEEVNQWKVCLENQIKETEDLPRLNELKPSTNLQRQFAVARSKQMEKSKEDAAEKSVFRQIAKQIPLKAGKGCFSYHGGVFGESNTLSSFSYSIEIPKREVLDPVGYALHRYYLRTAKKGDK